MAVLDLGDTFWAAWRDQKRKGRMRMAMTENGISTTKELGQFAYEEFYVGDRPPSYHVQWDYKDLAGVLHSGITRTLEDAQRTAAKFGYKS